MTDPNRDRDIQKIDTFVDLRRGLVPDTAVTPPINVPEPSSSGQTAPETTTGQDSGSTQNK